MMKGLILAFQFFTRIPIPISVEFNDRNLKNAMSCLGLVGIALGFVYATVFTFFAKYDLLISAVLVVFSMVLLTGGLHLDGLSDMADGFSARKNREKTLEIMKDSRIGAFGVISIVLILLMKFVFIYRAGGFYEILLSTANARFVVYILLLFGKSPVEGGLGQKFQQVASKKDILIISTVYLLFANFVGTKHLVPILFSIITALVIMNISNKKIGGVNGDINGACVEITELISIIIYWGIETWKFIW